MDSQSQNWAKPRDLDQQKPTFLLAFALPFLGDLALLSIPTSVL